jgi:hypothetical protein
MTGEVQVGDVIQPYKRGGDYVVVRTAMEGGGTGHGPHDIYPDGWHVEATKLDKDGNYDPDGKRIDFYQSGCFTGMIEEVKVVDRMRMTFVRAGGHKSDYDGGMVYMVTTEGDVEGRSTRTIGYARGRPEDIEMYFDDAKCYNIRLKGIDIIDVTEDNIGERKEMLTEKADLEARLKELERKLR